MPKENSLTKRNSAPLRHKAKKILAFRLSKETLRELIISTVEKFWKTIDSGDKSTLQTLHIQTRDLRAASRSSVARLYEKYRHCFISGANLDPGAIEPILRFVEPRTDTENLFRIVRWTWSMPYSAGYGRRLRFIVWDAHHKALIGIIGLQSPPIDLTVRDLLFKCPPNRKTDLINRTMDAYTIGAIPPYSNLLGGKLVAGLVASNEIQQMYWRQYAGRVTEMNRKRIKHPLVAITTTSAFGRSSIYNRLKFNDRLIAEPIGYTRGLGALHLELIYDHIIQFLRVSDPNLVLGGYGYGPKKRWQLIKHALETLKIPRGYFTHGIRRQVFLFRLVADLEQGMAGGDFGPAYDLSVESYSRFWLERWALPRAERDNRWRSFLSENYFEDSLAIKREGRTT